jgi:hypothetical protein
MRLIGADPGRDEIEAAWRVKRHRGMEETRSTAARAVASAPQAFQRLLKLAGMSPEDAVVRWGNFDRTFLLSSKVFEIDDEGRSYKLRPNTKSVWLKQRTLPKPDTGLLLIPDTPEIRKAVEEARVNILPGSEQSTNSWGCRGPEPDVNAPVRGLVIGDSFMQGLLVDDAHAPPACLERSLSDELKTRVAVLNTGVLGYSPEQYYFTLRQFAERFKPHFVLVSVFSNDFGDENLALQGQGDWEEGRYWLGQIKRYCLEKNLIYVLSPIVGHPQLTGTRTTHGYPSQVTEIAEMGTDHYLDPIEEFLTENLRLTLETRPGAPDYNPAPLYNLPLGDGHFNARGTELWGRILARRIAALLKRRELSTRPR